MFFNSSISRVLSCQSSEFGAHTFYDVYLYHNIFLIWFNASLQFLRLFVKEKKLLSQPNNNHNPNNKTTITVVGLRLSNHWEYHPHPHHHHTNSKIHDRVEIEQYSENNSY